MARRTTTTTAYSPGQQAGSFGGGRTTATAGSKDTTAATTSKDEADFEIILSHATSGRFYGGYDHVPGRSPTTATLGSLLNGLPRKSKQEITALQNKLVAAHLLNGPFSRGIADNATLAAYRELLDRSYFASQTPDEALNDAASAEYVKDAAARANQPFQAHVSSPEEIKAALDKAVPEILGHGLTDAESSQLAALYQSLQVKAQRQAYDTNLSGGTATDVVPFDVFAEREAERLHPNEAQAKKLADLAKSFMSMFESSPETRTF